MPYNFPFDHSPVVDELWKRATDICPFHPGQFFMSLYHILLIGPLLKLPAKKKKKKGGGSEFKKKKNWPFHNEMPIKPTRMAKIKKTDNIKCWQIHGTTETLIDCLWTTTLKNNLAIAYKVKYEQVTLPLRYLLKRNQNTCPQRDLYKNVHWILIYNNSNIH